MNTIIRAVKHLGQWSQITQTTLIYHFFSTLCVCGYFLFSMEDFLSELGAGRYAATKMYVYLYVWGPRWTSLNRITTTTTLTRFLGQRLCSLCSNVQYWRTRAGNRKSKNTWCAVWSSTSGAVAGKRWQNKALPNLAFYSKTSLETGEYVSQHPNCDWSRGGRSFVPKPTRRKFNSLWCSLSAAQISTTVAEARSRSAWQTYSSAFNSTLNCNSLAEGWCGFRNDQPMAGTCKPPDYHALRKGRSWPQTSGFIPSFSRNTGYTQGWPCSFRREWTRKMVTPSIKKNVE